jgi:hypothetical protein
MKSEEAGAEEICLRACRVKKSEAIQAPTFAATPRSIAIGTRQKIGRGIHQELSMLHDFGQMDTRFVKMFLVRFTIAYMQSPAEDWVLNWAADRTCWMLCTEAVSQFTMDVLSALCSDFFLKTFPFWLFFLTGWRSCLDSQYAWLWSVGFICGSAWTDAFESWPVTWSASPGARYDFMELSVLDDLRGDRGRDCLLSGQCVEGRGLFKDFLSGLVEEGLLSEVFRNIVLSVCIAEGLFDMGGTVCSTTLSAGLGDRGRLLDLGGVLVCVGRGFLDWLRCLFIAERWSGSSDIVDDTSACELALEPNPVIEAGERGAPNSLWTTEGAFSENTLCLDWWEEMRDWWGEVSIICGREAMEGEGMPKAGLEKFVVREDRCAKAGRLGNEYAGGLSEIESKLAADRSGDGACLRGVSLAVVGSGVWCLPTFTCDICEFDLEWTLFHHSNGLMLRAPDLESSPNAPTPNLEPVKDM